MDPHPLSNPLTSVLSIVAAAEQLGQIRTDASRRVGHVPHVAPEAYLHTTFAPLNDAELEQLSSAVGRTLPASYAGLLRRSNGVLLFSGSLAIFGLRRSNSRGPTAVEQPFSAIVPNTFERPPKLDPTSVVVGAYGHDGSRVVVDSTDSTLRIDRKTGQVLNRWPSLTDMLSAETKRMALLFDERGRLRSGEGSSAPPPDVDQ